MFGIVILNSFSIFLHKNVTLHLSHSCQTNILPKSNLLFIWSFCSSKNTQTLTYEHAHILTQPKYTDEQIYANSFNSRSIDLYFIFSNILGSKKLYWNEHDLNFLFLKKETVNVKEVMNNKPPAERYNRKPSTLKDT